MVFIALNPVVCELSKFCCHDKLIELTKENVSKMLKGALSHSIRSHKMINKHQTLLSASLNFSTSVFSTSRIPMCAHACVYVAVFIFFLLIRLLR